MMRMAVLQHVVFEGPAAVADWAAERAVPFRIFHLYRDTRFPALSDFDMLAVMGGPMSANDEAQLDWLGPESPWFARRLLRAKPCLGYALAPRSSPRPWARGSTREGPKK